MGFEIEYLPIHCSALHFTAVVPLGHLELSGFLNAEVDRQKDRPGPALVVVPWPETT